LARFFLLLLMMPERPDIDVLVHHLQRLFVGQPLQQIRLASPFLLRTVEPALSSVHGKRLTTVTRLGKRIVFGFDDTFVVLHLMIAGRIKALDAQAKIPAKVGLAAFDFPTHTVVLTEASSKKRASLHVLHGAAALAAHDPGGVEVDGLTPTSFLQVLHSERHTIKRTLTDPTLLSGIGNAYSDEILWRAQMAPTALSTSFDIDKAAHLLAVMKSELTHWTITLLADQKTPLGPDKVTAFRPDFAVHGKKGQPCPRCQSPVQAVVTGDSEMNYCATCQTGGKLLADRVLSKLLKSDFPKTLDALEAMKAHHRRS
jgi:formamidopyrimidine-DNA glycosylase